MPASVYIIKYYYYYYDNSSGRLAIYRNAPQNMLEVDRLKYTLVSELLHQHNVPVTTEDRRTSVRKRTSIDFAR